MIDISKWEVDALTGCFARKHFYEFFDLLKIESNISKTAFSIAFIDMDHFKGLNDKYGHMFGDDILKYFASTVRLCLESDYLAAISRRFIYRFGGDEFIIVFPGKDSREAYHVTQAISATIRKRPFLYHGRDFRLSFSAGIASYPTDGKTVDEIISCADKAMYFSKKHGHGVVTQFQGMRFEVFRVLLVATLSAALGFAYAGPVKSLIKQSVKASISKSFKHPLNKDIYFKSGGKLTGVIIKDGDPVLMKLSLDSGEGMIEIRKSEILKIVPAQK